AMPASRAPLISAFWPQPSKGTWGSVASSRASRWRSRSSPCSLTGVSALLELAFRLDRQLPIARLRHAVPQLVPEGEQRQVGHPPRVEPAVEMVAFMLHDAGVEAFGLALQPLAMRRPAGIADAGMARHHAGQARHRQAGLPAQPHLVVERLDL